MSPIGFQSQMFLGGGACLSGADLKIGCHMRGSNPSLPRKKFGVVFSQLWVVMPGLGFMVRLCLSLSHPLWCVVFSSFLQCVGVAYLVFRFLSEESFSYVPIDLLCLWENVSSHVAILNWNIHASLSLDSVGGIAYGHQLKSSIIVIFSPSHFVQMKDILQICYRSIPHLLPVEIMFFHGVPRKAFWEPTHGRLRHGRIRSLSPGFQCLTSECPAMEKA